MQIFRVVSINVSAKKGERKSPVERALLIEGLGIRGDAHAGLAGRQVSLLAMESILKMRGRGAEVNPGDFAENITTEGADITSLAVGTRIKIGDEIELEVTQIGKICRDRCEVYRRVGDCVMPREGIFADVVRGGRLEKNAEGRVE